MTAEQTDKKPLMTTPSYSFVNEPYKPCLQRNLEGEICGVYHKNSTRNKKLLFVTTRQFWPPSSGKEVALFHNCKGLNERYGYEIYLFCFADKKTDKRREVPAFIHEVKYVDVPGVRRSAPRILWKSLLTGKWPIQTSLFFTPEIAAQLKVYFEDIKPDAFILDMVRLAQYIDVLPPMSIPHILIEDDFLAKRYARQLSARHNSSIFGYLNDSMPGSLTRLTNTGTVSRAVLRGEIRRLERYEATLPAKFDYITFVSPIEAAEYNKRYHTDKAVTLTLGADMDYFEGGIPGECIPNSVSIVGNFAYGPNAASLEWTSTQILPLLPESISYYVVGNFPQELKEKLHNDKIIALGYVDDFRMVIKSTEVYLAPVLFGSGIKTKIVEAMAMGIPVVTNSIGAEGLDVHNGEELFIEDEPEQIAERTRQLLADSNLRKEIGRRGQAFVRKYHNWETIYDVFGTIGL